MLNKFNARVKDAKLKRHKYTGAVTTVSDRLDHKDLGQNYF